MQLRFTTKSGWTIKFDRAHVNAIDDEEFSLTYKMDARLSDFNFELACKKSISHYYPWTRLLFFGAFGLALLSYEVTIYLNNATNSGDYNFLAFIGIALPFSLLPYLALQRRKRLQRIRFGSLRSGVTSITMDETGYHSKKPGFHMFASWEHFADVIETRSGLILLVGVAEFFMIPKSSYPEGVSSYEIKHQILEWIAAARSAQPSIQG